MDFLAPLKWIDEKIQRAVDWFSHSIMRLFGIPISFQRYVYFTVIACCIVAQYFIKPATQRTAMDLLSLIFIVPVVILIQTKTRKFDELIETSGFNIARPRDPIFDIMKLFMLMMITADLLAKFNYSRAFDIIEKATWIILFYQFRTSSTPPPEKQTETQEAHGFSS